MAQIVYQNVYQKRAQDACRRFREDHPAGPNLQIVPADAARGLSTVESFTIDGEVFATARWGLEDVVARWVRVFNAGVEWARSQDAVRDDAS